MQYGEEDDEDRRIQVIPTLRFRSVVLTRIFTAAAGSNRVLKQLESRNHQIRGEKEIERENREENVEDTKYAGIKRKRSYDEEVLFNDLVESLARSERLQTLLYAYIQRSELLLRLHHAIIDNEDDNANIRPHVEDVVEHLEKLDAYFNTCDTLYYDANYADLGKLVRTDISMHLYNLNAKLVYLTLLGSEKK